MRQRKITTPIAPKRKTPEAVNDCCKCGNRPNITLIKTIKEIPNVITFDSNNLYYRVECNSCKSAGNENKSNTYHKKEDAYNNWNELNPSSSQRVS